MKKFLCILTALLIMIPNLSFAWYGDNEYEYTTMYCVVNVDSYVSIRENASRKSNCIGRMYFGDSIEVVRIKNGWAYVRCNTEFEFGYIKAEYLSFDKPIVVEKTMTVKSKGRVAVREFADGKRVRWVNNGKELDIYCIAGEWSIIKQNWRFIKTEYLEDINLNKETENDK